LRWTQPDGSAPTGFSVSLGSASGQYGETRDLGAVAPGPDGVHDADLVLDALVSTYVVLSAYNEAGASGYSNERLIAAIPCDAAFCEDGNPCTLDECGEGECVREQAPDGTACAAAGGEGLCLAGRCELVECLADVDCGDGDACNGVELCVGNACRTGAAPACGGATACTAASCDPVLGCLTTPVPDGTACDDADPATTDDRCTAGSCAGVVPPPPPPPPACDAASCEDGNFCTVDACLDGGCSHAPAPDGTACDDGSAATLDDQCRAGVCAGTLAPEPPPPPASCPVSCEDGNPCTADACSDGHCVNVPLADGTACSDGNKRTRGERCSAGVCSGGVWKGPHKRR
jgi:hypothetical protein